MKYYFQGKTLEEAVRQSVSGVACKTDTRAECDRISRIRATHANRIEVVLEDIGDTIEDINSKVEDLGDDAREALIATVGDVSSIAFAGAGA